MSIAYILTYGISQHIYHNSLVDGEHGYKLYLQFVPFKETKAK